MHKYELGINWPENNSGKGVRKQPTRLNIIHHLNNLMSPYNAKMQD